MRAIRFAQHGDPLSVLALEHIASPSPGAGEVRVRLTHRPINPADLLIVKGQYRIFATPPLAPGLEGAGVIDALGEGVQGLAVGQRVISLAGQPGHWAEQYVMPAERVLPIPDAIPDQAAAQTLANPVTAWALVNDDLPLREGDWLLQTAASSAVGRLVVQLARRRGIRTLNVVRRRARVRDVLDWGGDAVVSTDDESLIDRVKAITGGAGVAAAIDAVGGDLGGQVAECVRPGGVMCSYGVLSGTALNGVDIKRLIFDGTTIRGFWVTEWFGRRPADVIGRALTEVVTMLAAGELTTTTEAEYDLADFARAIEHAEKPGRHGKILLVG